MDMEVDVVISCIYEHVHKCLSVYVSVLYVCQMDVEVDVTKVLQDDDDEIMGQPTGNDDEVRGIDRNGYMYRNAYKKAFLVRIHTRWPITYKHIVLLLYTYLH